MKKSLLFIASAALFASCSDDLLEPNNGFQALNEKGITFTVVDDATRGMIDSKTFKANFFAEQDEINIWSDNVLQGTTAMDKFGSPVSYKATKSVGDPNFTGVSANDILSFKTFNSAKGADNTAKFFVAYPKEQSVSNAYDEKTKVRTFTVTPGIDLMNQTMSKGYMDMDKRLMYDYAEVTRTGNESILEQNQSLGDKVQLRLISPVTAAFFKISDIETYKEQFGNLLGITLTSEYSPLVPANSNQELTVNKEDLVVFGEKKYFKNDLAYVINEKGEVVYSIPKDGDGNDITLDNYASITSFPTDYLGVMANDLIEFKVAADGKKTATWKKVAQAIVRSATLAYGNTEASDENPTLGAAIDNNTVMNLYILPTEDHTKKAENYTVVYKFDNATLTFPFKKDRDFDENGAAFYSKVTDLNCIVTEGTKTGTNHNNDRILIINSGTLSDILVKENGKVKNFSTTGKVYKIQWNAEQIPTTQFKNITINTEVADEEWAYLNTFTKAETLTLSGAKCTNLGSVAGMTSLTKIDAPHVTTVVKEAFGATANGTLTHLFLPAVISFGAQKADFKFSALTELNLNSYNSFGKTDQVVPGVFFNDDAKSETTGLKVINLASVSNLRDQWVGDTKILFDGYKALTTVTLKDGVMINSYQFRNCKNLKTVNGVLDISNAESAFEGCSSGVTGTDTPLQAVKITGTDIPAGAFKGSKVYAVRDKDNEDVKPTSIGANAFNGNTAIKTMNLSNAGTIGEGAFQNALKFTGDADGDGLATLAVEVVETNAFDGTAIIRFQLDNALQTKSGSLNSSKVQKILYIKDLKKIEDEDGKLVSPIADDQVNDERKPYVSIYVTYSDDEQFFTGKGYSQVGTNE